MPAHGHSRNSASRKNITKKKGAAAGLGLLEGDENQFDERQSYVSDPPPTPGGVWIDMAMSLERICEINSKDQNFTVIVSMTLHWVDERIPDMNLPDASKAAGQMIWKPEYYIPGEHSTVPSLSQRAHARLLIVCSIAQI